jgi:hypothetical protein
MVLLANSKPSWLAIAPAGALKDADIVYQIFGDGSEENDV